MRYLFSAWGTVKARIGTKNLLLFFDFDGTLAPIVSTPQKAGLPHETLEMLNVLSQIESCKIAIVSGRALADVRQRIGIESLVYMGNHGLEIKGPQIQHEVAVGKDYAKTLQRVKPDLQAAISSYKGAFIEDKGLTLSVHFRLVDMGAIVDLRNKVRAVLSPYSMKNMIRVRSGKMVFEIRPPVLWDKGKAVLWLMDRWREGSDVDPAVPLYCGDDATDEDAFRMLADKGVTVVVGAHDDSAAQYFLNTQEEVSGLLRNIIELRKSLP